MYYSKDPAWCQVEQHSYASFIGAETKREFLHFHSQCKKTANTFMFSKVRLQPRTCTGYKHKKENSLFGNYNMNHGCCFETFESRVCVQPNTPWFLGYHVEVSVCDKRKVLRGGE